MSAILAKDPQLRSVVTEGSRVLVGQGTAEPLTLTRAFMREADELPPCSLFIGPTFSDTFAGQAPEHIRFESYGAIGAASKLARDKRLHVFPEHFSSLAEAFRDGSLPVETVLLQLRPSLKGCGYNLGLARDFVVDAARRAKHVIAEINPWLPACRGGEIGYDLELTHIVEAEHPPVEVQPAVVGETEEKIASIVAGLIPDGAVIQVGVGAIPTAVLRALVSHKDLGFHSGGAPDELVDLAESGVINNAKKEVDQGVSVTGILLGSRKLYEFAHRNPAFRLAGPQKTHSLSYIAQLKNFFAINSALEVDLTGQVGAEEVGGRHVGAVGGQVDYVRAARYSEGGRAIIAFQSTTRDGRSRIVPEVGTVTCARSDVDIIVTEHGAAELRGQSLDERAKRLIAIAAPQWREALERAWFEGRAEL